MDQSIRYISYFSWRKRKEKERKTVSFLLFYTYKYVKSKKSTARVVGAEGGIIKVGLKVGGEGVEKLLIKKTYLLNVLSAFVHVEFSPPLLSASSAILV